MQDFVKFKMAAVAILDVAQTPLSPNFSRVCFPAVMLQIKSKSDNKWASYAKFCEIQDGSRGHLGSSADPCFHQISVEYVSLLLCFKFRRNRTIYGRVIQYFVKLKMAAAAILDVKHNLAFTIFQ